jgi:hypothetical protein
MSTARKYAYNGRSMSQQSRNGAYAAMNIMWLQMRPDLQWESKDVIREERLIWIQTFLGLKRGLKSTTDLNDKQIGVVLEEMRRLTGTSSPKPNNTPFGKKPDLKIPSCGADVIHLASEEQQFTARKLFEFLGWNVERIEEFLRDRFNCPNVAMLRFNKANSLMMILLNIAAHADLKAKGLPTGRAATAKHIKFIKKKLQIGD